MHLRNRILSNVTQLRLALPIGGAFLFAVPIRFYVRGADQPVHGYAKHLSESTEDLIRGLLISRHSLPRSNRLSTAFELDSQPLASEPTHFACPP